MTKNLFFVLFSIIIFCLSSIAFGQDKTSTPSTITPRRISGGVVNGRAVSLPKPKYPIAAREAKIGGSVNVQVVIDRGGNIISAEAVSGHPLLRTAAIQAAKLSKFQPTLLEGSPVEVSGVIVYNFIQDNPKFPQENYDSNQLEKKGPEFDLKFIPMAYGLFTGTYDYIGENNAEADEVFIELTDLYLTFNKDYILDVDFKAKSFEEKKKTVNKFREVYKTNLTPSATWQFTMGSHLGQLMGRFGEDEDNFKLQDASELKISLSHIRDLTYSRPTDFPEPLLKKLVDLGKFADREDLGKRTIQREVAGNIVKILEAVFGE